MAMQRIAPIEERQPIADRLRRMADEFSERSMYMTSYEADFLRDVADRIAVEVEK